MEYEQNIAIENEMFDKTREDINNVMQRMIKNMISKNSREGSLTVKIDLSVNAEMIDNFNPKIDGRVRQALIPEIEHKVSSVIKVSDEEKGKNELHGYELVWDEDMEQYVMKPITGTAQMNIFDAEFREVPPDENEVASLPGPSNMIEEKPVEDISDEIIDADVLSDDDEITRDNMPFVDDGYNYEEPDM